MPIVYNLGKQHNFWNLLEWIQSFPAALLTVLVAGLTGIVLIFSWLLSVRIYERKEF